MALTIAYMPPTVKPPAGNAGSPPVFGAVASKHINAYDFCQLVTGTLVPALVGATTNLVGIATADSNAVFFQNDTDVQGVFGVTQMSATAGLFPISPDFVLVETLNSPMIVEMSLSQAYYWNPGNANVGTPQVTFGSSVGLNVVGGTGGIGALQGNTNFYYADPAQPACGTIVGVVSQPYTTGAATALTDAAGNLGGRVLVAFNASALAVVGT